MKAMKKSKVFTKLLTRITKEKCEDVATEYIDQLRERLAAAVTGPGQIPATT